MLGFEVNIEYIMIKTDKGCKRSSGFLQKESSYSCIYVTVWWYGLDYFDLSTVMLLC